MENERFSPFYESAGICTDTRNIYKDCLFVCIKGENFDGNTFASQAIKNGAKHVIVDSESYFVNDGSMTLVDNSVEYLQQLANFHRNKFNIPVIGITGSNGKTSTKELINAVLNKKYNVLATEGNLNNHLGVPFTLLRMNETHEIAIIEMGANRFKDIEELCAIAEPEYGIITNIGKAHLEGFGSFEGVLKTKRELYEAIASKNGTLIVNGDDETLLNSLPEGITTFKYGTGAHEIHGELVGLSPFVEMTWSYQGYKSPKLETQMIGKYNFYNYLAAAAFGIFFKVNPEDISNAIEEYSPENKRSQVKKSASNTLILDCYNANPTSMKSALESFAMMDGNHKFFIIGDMRELGSESKTEHRKIIEQIESSGLRGYTVGEEFGKMQSNSIIQHFKSSEEAKLYFSENTQEHSLILLKGSRGIQLEVLEEVL